MTRLVDTIRAVGLVVDERFQWLGATRDFEVGKFGCLEIKSYKQFEKLGKWLDQMLVQVYVSNSQSGGKKNYNVLVQVRLSESQSPFVSLAPEEMVRWWRLGVLRMKLEIVTLDETLESQAERKAFVAELKLPEDTIPTVTHFTSEAFEANQLTKVAEAYAHTQS